MSEARPRPWWRPSPGALGCLLLLAAIPAVCLWTAGDSARRVERTKARLRPGMTLGEALALGASERMVRFQLTTSRTWDPETWIQPVGEGRWVRRSPPKREATTGTLEEIARALERDLAERSGTWWLLLHWPGPGFDTPGPDLLVEVEVVAGVARLR